jgi:riboflavin kinase/FMN adenylyltransferase
MATSLEHLSQPQPTVLTVGFFDGVHLGHRVIIDRVVSEARQRGVRSAVLTFDPHPKTVLNGQPIDLLTTLDEKSALISEAGIDEVIVAHFDESLSKLSPRDFVTDILIDRIGLVHAVVGYDHRFGHGGAGDAQTMVELGSELGYTTEVIEPHQGAAGPHSSSSIRSALLDNGDVASAASQLGRLYSVTGRVVKGDGRGKQVGFPTANLDLENDDKIVPANGVYAVFVSRPEKETRHSGIMNIGVRPTLTSGLRRVLEAHLLRFYDDLYDELLTVEFVDRIREEHKFKGIETLRTQISKDISDCIQVLDTVSSLD